MVEGTISMDINESLKNIYVKITSIDEKLSNNIKRSDTDHELITEMNERNHKTELYIRESIHKLEMTQIDGIKKMEEKINLRLDNIEEKINHIKYDIIKISTIITAVIFVLGPKVYSFLKELW
jgi:DNA repair ATPase RecN